jgi:Ca2+-binding RTX toxin-like protein
VAKHTFYGLGPSLFVSNSGFAVQRPSHLSESEFDILNTDGMQSVFRGSGFVYDAFQSVFIGGTVSSILHFDSSGLALDNITAIAVPASQLGQLFFSVTETVLNSSVMVPNIFSGDDVIDARNRVNGGSINTLIYANAGNDTIKGYRGNDFMTGGNGSDSFVFSRFTIQTPQKMYYYGFDNDSTVQSNDIISDFVVGNDHLLINDFVSIALADTADGIVVNVTMYTDSIFEASHDSTTAGSTFVSNILLSGLHGSYVIGDFI